MKGFIAATLSAAPYYARLNLKRPIHLAFTYDEEVGCIGAKSLISTLKKWGFCFSAAIVGEPTEMRIIEGHKSCNQYTMKFQGLSGHSSRPESGVNAIEYATKYINNLLQISEELKLCTP
jgi:acetylornithine deacetylase